MGGLVRCSILAAAAAAFAMLPTLPANASMLDWPKATISGRTDPAAVVPGQKLDIVWTVSNDQSERLTDVRLYSSVNEEWQAEFPEGSRCDFHSGSTTHLSCGVGDLAPGQHESITVTAMVPMDEPSGQVEFIASAASAETPADAGAPVARTTVTVTGSGDAAFYTSDSSTYTSTCEHGYAAGAYTSTCTYKPGPAESG